MLGPSVGSHEKYYWCYRPLIIINIFHFSWCALNIGSLYKSLCKLRSSLVCTGTLALHSLGTFLLSLSIPFNEASLQEQRLCFQQNCAFSQLHMLQAILSSFCKGLYFIGGKVHHHNWQALNKLLRKVAHDAALVQNLAKHCLRTMHACLRCKSVTRSPDIFKCSNLVDLLEQPIHIGTVRKKYVEIDQNKLYFGFLLIVIWRMFCLIAILP